MKLKNLLIIGHTFPEPSTTAAGSRMMQLIALFKVQEYRITFASTAAVSERTFNLESQNVFVKNILLNDASFDGFIKELNPEIVIFDRYIFEEQFGWRVSENCPKALKILDTEDLHFLRKAREEAVKNNLSIDQAYLYTDAAKREIASIFRCDLSLIISEFEMELLQKTFKLPSSIIYYLPFLLEDLAKMATFPSFEERQNFITVGNLLHQPNVDGVLQLKKIWPSIKKELPESEIHIYGAYAPQKILQLHNPKEGFLLKGWVDNLEAVMKNARLQLAPLRFGAGLKGKLIDAMRVGTPSITTSLGAEGLNGELPFSGIIANTDESFIKAAVQLYSNKEVWESAQNDGFQILQNRFQKEIYSENFLGRVKQLITNLDFHRKENFVGQILQHSTLQSTKYLSKWIEAKNSLLQNSSPVCYATSAEVREEYR